MTSIKPAGHRVLVKPAPIETVSKGGIIIPDDGRKEEAQVRGTLVAIGFQAWEGFGDGKPWAAVGDTVLYAKYGGYLVTDTDGTAYRVLNDDDIAAIVEV